MKYIRYHDPQLWRDIAAVSFDIGYYTLYMKPEELATDFQMFQAVR